MSFLRAYENGKPAGSWGSLGDRAVLTSIALAEDDVFAADAGNAVVVRYDTSGKIVGRMPIAFSIPWTGKGLWQSQLL